MLRQWPSTIGFDRQLFQEKWSEHPKLLTKLDHFVEFAIESIVTECSTNSSLSLMDPEELDRKLKQLGERLEGLYQFDPDRIMENRILHSRLNSTYRNETRVGSRAPNVRLVGQRQAS